MKCSVRECESEQKSRGLCQAHYRRARASGAFQVRKYEKNLDRTERLWSKIDKRGPDECWPWTGKAKVQGYGLAYLGPNERNVRAHRAAWEMTNGPIPPSDAYHGTVVMHICDNRICCNPNHLRLGTHDDNMADMAAKGRGVIPRKFGKGVEHILASPKLNDAAIREIRAAKKGRKEIVALACKYDLEIANVYNIRSRRTWKHVA